MNKTDNQHGLLQRIGMVAGTSKEGVGLFFREFYALLKQSKDAFKTIVEHRKKHK